MKKNERLPAFLAALLCSIEDGCLIASLGKNASTYISLLKKRGLTYSRRGYWSSRVWRTKKGLRVSAERLKDTQFDKIRGEIWRPVVGYERCYQISNFGRARSIDRTRLKSNGVSHTTRGRILKPGINIYRRGEAFIIPRSSGVPLKIHRLVLEAFVGPRPDGCVACHENDIASDNRLANLRWDTPKSNHLDFYRNNGGVWVGSKLNAYQVREIRARFHAGESTVNIRNSMVLDVCETTVRNICQNRNYKHILP